MKPTPRSIFALACVILFFAAVFSAAQHQEIRRTGIISNISDWLRDSGFFAATDATAAKAALEIDESGGVDDTAYDASTWDGVTDTAPSKNAVRDKIESIITGGGMGTGDIDTSAKLRSILTDESGTGASLFAGGNIGAATATSPAADADNTTVSTTEWVWDRLANFMLLSETNAFAAGITNEAKAYFDQEIADYLPTSSFNEAGITNALGMNLVGLFDAKQPTNNILTRLGSAPVTITFADPLPTDASLGCYFRATLTDNFTLANPTNPLDGQRILWELIQDGTGSRLITLGNKFALGSDITAVTLTTTLNKRDFLTAVYNSTSDKWYVVGISKGY